MLNMLPSDHHIIPSTGGSRGYSLSVLIMWNGVFFRVHIYLWKMNKMLHFRLNLILNSIERGCGGGIFRCPTFFCSINPQMFNNGRMIIRK